MNWWKLIKCTLNGSAGAIGATGVSGVFSQIKALLMTCPQQVSNSCHAVIAKEANSLGLVSAWLDFFFSGFFIVILVRSF